MGSAGITTWCGTADRGTIHLTDSEDLASGPVPTYCGRELRLLPLSLKAKGDTLCGNCRKVLHAPRPNRRFTADRMAARERLAGRLTPRGYA